MDKAQNIVDAVPAFAEDFIDLTKQVYDREEYENYLLSNIDRVGEFSRYLQGKIHDSQILKTTIVDSNLTFILNDMSTHVFADALVERKSIKVDHEKLVFPLHICFKEVDKFQYYSVDEGGFMHPISNVDPTEYLYEHFTYINESNFGIAFQMWSASKGEGKPGRKVILMVSAKDLEIQAYQREVWIEIFGKKYDNYYNYYLSKFNSNRFVSDYTECLKLVDEVELMNNIERKPTA